MLDTSINVKTDRFDGPLGLLLLLVKKQEIQIKDISITEITKQYLDYLNKLKDLNFDLAGDFLYMAATLLLLKSKSCVTEEEVESLVGDLEGAEHIATRAELIRRLEELQRFQKLGSKLWELPRRGEDVFTRPRINRKNIINSLLVPMELDGLLNSMMDFMFREKRKYKVVRRDRLSIKEKLEFLKEFLQQGVKTSLDEIIEHDITGREKGGDLTNLIITFISLLELARLKRISVFQNEDSGAIYVDVEKNLEDFDVNSADGFDSESDVAMAEAAKKEADEKKLAEELAAQAALEATNNETTTIQ